MHIMHVNSINIYFLSYKGKYYFQINKHLIVLFFENKKTIHPFLKVPDMIQKSCHIRITIFYQKKSMFEQCLFESNEFRRFGTVFTWRHYFPDRKCAIFV